MVNAALDQLLNPQCGPPNAFVKQCGPQLASVTALWPASQNNCPPLAEALLELTLKLSGYIDQSRRSRFLCCLTEGILIIFFTEIRGFAPQVSNLPFVRKQLVCHSFIHNFRYAEMLLQHYFCNDKGAFHINIITPSDVKQRGCQLSLVFSCPVDEVRCTVLYFIHVNHAVASSRVKRLNALDSTSNYKDMSNKSLKQM